MLTYALRRLLWAVPTLFGVSIVVFYLTTLLPEPPLPSLPSDRALRSEELVAQDLAREARRMRFLDLPRFANPKPSDVRTAVEGCLADLSRGGAAAQLAARRLVALGGAALPFALPELERLPPSQRGALAVALEPLGARMGLADEANLQDPARAALFWSRFWEDRSVDFTEPAVRRAVQRFARQGTAVHTREVRLADTLALEELVQAMDPASDTGTLARLTGAAAHATGRGTVTQDGDSLVVRRRVVADWREWWFVHRADHVPLGGAERVAATLTETRYGKWITRVSRGELGVSVRDGEPILHKMRARAGLTLLVTGSALLASLALAIPLGVISAWRRGRTLDRALAAMLFALYAMPAFWAAELLARWTSPGDGPSTTVHRLILAVVALTAASLATLSRHQRAALLEVLGQDYVRTAQAKGLTAARVLLVHALRNALIPTLTMASLQLPALLGGAFIVEEVLGLPGLGFETVRAVEGHDAPWLMSTVLLAALLTTLTLVASDIAYGALDPRVRETLARRATAHGAAG